MQRIIILLSLVLTLAGPGIGALHAQADGFPLPADLYILTSEGHVIRVDRQHGGQSLIAPNERRITDFAIALDGAWYALRTQDNAMVLVSAIDRGSGYVLEFDAAPPPDPGATMAWAPDVSALAYAVADGVHIAAPGSGPYGEPAIDTVAGGPWTTLYWTGPDTLIAQDAAGNATRITHQDGAWRRAALADAPPQPAPVAATLTPDGVQLDDGTLVPGTAGALAFAWGPVPPPVALGTRLPAPLYYVAADPDGTPRVWQLPADGEPPFPVTPAGVPVTTYAVAGEQIAYISGDQLITARRDGTTRQVLTTLALDRAPLTLAWDPDGARLAYTDAGGLWLYSPDSDTPWRRLLAHQPPDTATGPTGAQLFSTPRWGPDGARLLVDVLLYEGSLLGVVDVASGTLTTFTNSGQAAWTPDGRIITWSAQWGYTQPGLYLIDPAAPDADPQTILGPDTPVVDVQPAAAGDWAALVSSTATLGPQFVRAWRAPSLPGPYAPVAGDLAGGFVREARLAVGPDGSLAIAGLRDAQYDDAGRASGTLALIRLPAGDTHRIHTIGPVRDLRWAR